MKRQFYIFWYTLCTILFLVENFYMFKFAKINWWLIFWNEKGLYNCIGNGYKLIDCLINAYNKMCQSSFVHLHESHSRWEVGKSLKTFELRITWTNNDNIQMIFLCIKLGKQILFAEFLTQVSSTWSNRRRCTIHTTLNTIWLFISKSLNKVVVNPM